MKRGFSTTESLVVLSIVGLLVIIALPVFLRARHYASAGACKDKLKEIHRALVEYSRQHGSEDGLILPPSLSSLGMPRSSHTCMRLKGETPFVAMWLAPGWDRLRQTRGAVVLVADSNPHLSQGGGVALFTDGSIRQKAGAVPGSLEHWSSL